MIKKTSSCQNFVVRQHFLKIKITLIIENLKPCDAFKKIHIVIIII